MRILDLFCGGGGAGSGYMRAGIECVGVDLKYQKFYPSTFVQADALEYLKAHGHEFDAIHASPPCQGYSTATGENSKWVNYSQGKDTPRLIEPLREILQQIGKPYVIENVAGAKDFLRSPFLLCGSMFGLPIPRHRFFESSFQVDAPAHPACRGIAKAAAIRLGYDYRDMSVTGKGRHAGVKNRWAVIMGITHEMTQTNFAEAIPPAYTEFIGRQLLKNKSTQTQFFS